MGLETIGVGLVWTLHEIHLLIDSYPPHVAATIYSLYTECIVIKGLVMISLAYLQITYKNY